MCTCWVNVSLHIHNHIIIFGIQLLQCFSDPDEITGCCALIDRGLQDPTVTCSLPGLCPAEAVVTCQSHSSLSCLPWQQILKKSSKNIHLLNILNTADFNVSTVFPDDAPRDFSPYCNGSKSMSFWEIIKMSPQPDQL